MAEPAVLTFVLIPVVLALLLAAGARTAARRAGASPAVAWRRGIVTLAAASDDHGGDPGDDVEVPAMPCTSAA